MPVSIEAELVGVTPARFTVQPQALSVVVGNGSALLHPASDAIVATAELAARSVSSSAAPPALGDERRSVNQLLERAAPLAHRLVAPVVTAAAGAAVASV